MTGDEFLAPRQVAALFHVNPKTVARWAEQGKIGFVITTGGHRRYHRAEIHALRNALTDPGPTFPDVDTVSDMN